MFRNSYRLFFIVAVGLLGASCGADKPTSSSVEGTYMLERFRFATSVQGVPIEWVPPMITGTLTLAGSEYTVSIPPTSQTRGYSDSGRFTVSGNTITLTSSDSGSITGRIFGQQITYFEPTFNATVTFVKP